MKIRKLDYSDIRYAAHFRKLSLSAMLAVTSQLASQEANHSSYRLVIIKTDTNVKRTVFSGFTLHITVNMYPGQLYVNDY